LLVHIVLLSNMLKSTTSRAAGAFVAEPKCGHIPSDDGGTLGLPTQVAGPLERPLVMLLAV
jgi:hypothetical protein